jgi:hypothetical protein
VCLAGPGDHRKITTELADRRARRPRAARPHRPRRLELAELDARVGGALDCARRGDQSRHVRGMELADDARTRRAGSVAELVGCPTRSRASAPRHSSTAVSGNSRMRWPTTTISSVPTGPRIPNLVHPCRTRAALSVFKTKQARRRAAPARAARPGESDSVAAGDHAPGGIGRRGAQSRISMARAAITGRLNPFS